MKNRLFQVCTYEKQQKVHIGHSACVFSHLACEECTCASLRSGPGCQAGRLLLWSAAGLHYELVLVCDTPCELQYTQLQFDQVLPKASILVVWMLRATIRDAARVNVPALTTNHVPFPRGVDFTADEEVTFFLACCALFSAE